MQDGLVKGINNIVAFQGTVGHDDMLISDDLLLGKKSIVISLQE